METILSIPSYGLVLAAATSVGFLNIYQSINVGKARKLAGIPYPQTQATEEQCKADFNAMKFNSAVRAHQNTLDNQTFFLFSLLYSGIQFPLISTGLGFTWVIGRFFYTRGYSTGHPDKRNQGVFHMIGFLGLLVTSCMSTYNIISAGL